jgi:uncharacterized protein (DUF169 family)
MQKYVDFSKKIKKLLGLKSSPVAVSFSTKAPAGVKQMKGEARLCQMLDMVRLDGESFYTTADNHACDGGAGSCGMKEMSERIRTGEFLVRMGLFGSTRAARRFISSNPRVETGTVSVTSFSPLEKASFEPDIVVLICNAKQGMVVSEAYAYETGKRTTGMTGPPICSSIVAAPFITGEIVYSLGDHGARKNMRVSDDDIFVGIPAELLSCIVGNLEKMKNL